MTLVQEYLNKNWLLFEVQRAERLRYFEIIWSTYSRVINVRVIIVWYADVSADAYLHTISKDKSASFFELFEAIGIILMSCVLVIIQSQSVDRERPLLFIFQLAWLLNNRLVD